MFHAWYQSFCWIICLTRNELMCVWIVILEVLRKWIVIHCILHEVKVLSSSTHVIIISVRNLKRHKSPRLPIRNWGEHARKARNEQFLHTIVRECSPHCKAKTPKLERHERKRINLPKCSNNIESRERRQASSIARKRMKGTWALLLGRSAVSLACMSIEQERARFSNGGRPTCIYRPHRKAALAGSIVAAKALTPRVAMLLSGHNFFFQRDGLRECRGLRLGCTPFGSTFLHWGCCCLFARPESLQTDVHGIHFKRREGLEVHGSSCKRDHHGNASIDLAKEQRSGSLIRLDLRICVSCSIEWRRKMGFLRSFFRETCCRLFCELERPIWPREQSGQQIFKGNTLSTLAAYVLQTKQEK